MLIVGELINTSRKAIKPAVESRDAAFIKEIAQKQVDAGADYIDVTVGTRFLTKKRTMAGWLKPSSLRQARLYVWTVQIPKLWKQASRW